MSYFTRCETLNELKATYRRLALEHHPDRGGDTATMQAINAEYEQAFSKLKAQYNAEAREGYKTTETADEFRRVVLALIRLEGLEVELCGSWLWIGGETKANKEALKEAGCKWCKSKHKWYWHHFDRKRRRGTGYTMGEIRAKYGSVVIEAKKGTELATV